MGFAGKSIYYSYLYANSSSPWIDEEHSNVFFSDKIAVSDGVEIGGEADLYTVDISDDQIRFNFHDTGLFTRAAFNGPTFEDRDGVLLPIVGFTLATNMSGLTKDDIIILSGGDQVYINWQGTSLTTDSYLVLTFRFGRNPVVGTKGADTLRGTLENDLMTGGKGVDKLYGGEGSDVFAFATSDSGKSNAQADTIFDFNLEEGDKIDLSKWDANSKKAGIQHFTFIGDDAFSKEVGELRVGMSKGDTYIQGNTDTNGKPDFTIHLSGAVELDRGDLVL